MPKKLPTCHTYFPFPMIVFNKTCGPYSSIVLSTVVESDNFDNKI